MLQMHASVVALNGKGVLITGPSGSGKSTLALQMMAVGAELVSDDRTDLTGCDGGVVASCPAPLSGLIEARGVGLLRAVPHGPVRIALAVDLGRLEEDRLPHSHRFDLCGSSVPLVLGPYRPHLYSALRQWLMAGRMDAQS